MKNLFKKIYSLWMYFVRFLGTINGYLILFIFYFILLGIYAILYKLASFIISLFTKSAKNSSWQNQKDDDGSMENMSYQF